MRHILLQIFKLICQSKKDYRLRTRLFLVINFVLNYAIRKVQENEVGLKLNKTHKLLVYADDVNLLGGNVDTVKQNTETVIDVSKSWSRSKHRDN
jgi:hypothetical protein